MLSCPCLGPFVGCGVGVRWWLVYSCPALVGVGSGTLLGPEESAVRAARESGRVVGASGCPLFVRALLCGGEGVGGVVV